MAHHKDGIKYEDMDEKIEAIIPTVDKVFNEIAGRDAIITSAREGNHSRNSRHYSGQAIDLRTRDLTPDKIEKVRVKLQNSLGKDYDVVKEETHIHVEYDPKNQS